MTWQNLFYLLLVRVLANGDRSTKTSTTTGTPYKKYLDIIKRLYVFPKKQKPCKKKQYEVLRTAQVASIVEME
jgi:hypothetical protein